MTPLVNEGLGVSLVTEVVARTSLSPRIFNGGQFVAGWVVVGEIGMSFTVTALAFPGLIRLVNSDSCDLDLMRAQSLTTWIPVLCFLWGGGVVGNLLAFPPLLLI